MLAIVASPLRAAQKLHCSPAVLAYEWLLFVAADKKQLDCRGDPRLIIIIAPAGFAPPKPARRVRKPAIIKKIKTL